LRPRARRNRWIGTVAYWLAVAVVSVVLVALLLQLLHLLDGATVGTIAIGRG
jgi:hypothetical protein